MNKKKIIIFLIICLGLVAILTFTFKHFKEEEEKILETANKNKLIEEQDKKEKEVKELEEKRKKEEGQKEVQDLIDKLKNTKKVVLATSFENGSITSLDGSHKYKEVKTITEENTIKEIVSIFEKAVWQEEINANFLNILWKFYDGEEKLILEYEGHAFVTSEKKIGVYLAEDFAKQLSSYFEIL